MGVGAWRYLRDSSDTDPGEDICRQPEAGLKLGSPKSSDEETPREQGRPRCEHSPCRPHTQQLWKKQERAAWELPSTFCTTVGQRQSITGHTGLTEVGRIIGADSDGVTMPQGRATHRSCGHHSREAHPPETHRGAGSEDL